MTLQELEDEVLSIKRAVFGQARLRLEDLQHRYGWSLSTAKRRVRDGTIPPPLHFPGQPIWRLEDILAAEDQGQLPAPLSS